VQTPPTRVKPLEVSKASGLASRRPTESRDQYRFLNPYNFVCYLPEPSIPPGDSDAQLLGRCPPPPHDRYIGLTGRITCTLETVTPLFIADSHDVRVTKVLLASGREVEHKSYRFFQYGGKDAIPATSLRGMIRSVFEAVTNSPLSVFDGDNRLEYRIDPAEARHFKPGIVRSLPKDGQPGVIALCEEAKAGAYYIDSRRNVLDDSWHCGDEAYADVKRDDKGVMRVTMIVHGGTSQAAIGGMERGWVKVTGPTIDTKRNESFFYFKGDPAKARSVSFDVERENDFNAVLHAQLHERSEDFRSQVQNDRLTPGDLVYVELEPGNNRQVRNIALARVARLRYRNAIGDLLPDHLKPSEYYDQLDIASRVFGWVKARQDEDRNARVAYAGRVRFGHATLTEDGDKGTYKDEIPLAILGEPKPTTTLFYLQKKDGTWTEAERKQPGAASTIGYDGPNQLRGRKFYRHHGAALNRLEYERAGNHKDHQNRSVRGVRAPGNVFEFSIAFHNLAPVELGALLWALKLGDESCFHRLGYAKPLGFGSIRLKVQTVETIDMGHRYENLAENARRKLEPAQFDPWIGRYEKAMARCYGQPLRQLDNIRDLFSLLRDPDSTLPRHIHYPRIETRPDPEGKNFEWFVANKAKSTHADKAGQNLTLDRPGEESRGLPLLTKIRKP
ncbi:MAG: TIGR03986 family CRISPR-associated RAMP protein, partial [Anaerolineae bacterium]